MDDLVVHHIALNLELVLDLSDDLLDVRVGRGAALLLVGFSVALVLDEFSEFDELRLHRAELILEGLLEVLKLLGCDVRPT